MKGTKYGIIIRNAMIWLACLLLLNGIYMLFMTVTFALPVQERVRGNIEASLPVWEEGGESEAPVFKQNSIFWSDTSSEMLLVNTTATVYGNPAGRGAALYWLSLPDTGEIPPVHQYRSLAANIHNPDDPALSVESYERYWYLLAGVFRLLFCFLTIGEIRWLLYAGGALLTLLLFCRVYRIAGARGVVPLGIAMLFRCLGLNMAGTATAMDVYVALCAMTAVTYLYKKKRFREQQALFFFITGSVTFAIGPFIAPLLTLGMTQILLILLDQTQDRDPGAWKQLVANAVAWGAGYVLTMLVKALVSSVVVGNSDGFGVAFHYLGGSGHATVADRVARIFYGLEHLMYPTQAKLVIILILAGVFLVRVIRKGPAGFCGILQTGAVSCYPLLWFFVVYAHSMHDYASNIFAITAYGIAAIAAYSTGNGRGKG
ncbi:MAG: hypothetical protein IJQ21_13000 [Lachnospiraceae bacterium]|nr:hypothetical protein [Lachnospiraceae bacterium]